MSLEDIYHSLEDRYYQFLDKIDQYIPIYKVIDPIDRVFPSFILFILLFILIILGIFFLVLPFIFQQAAVFTVAVEDENKDALPNTRVSYVIGEGEEKTVLAKGLDAITDGIDAKVGDSVSISIEKDGYEDFSDSFIIDRADYEFTAVLEESLEPVEYDDVTVNFVDEYGSPVNDPVNIVLACTYSSNTIAPTVSNPVSGGFSVRVSSECQGLKITQLWSQTDRYELREGGRLNSGSNRITLYLKSEDPDAETGSIRVKIFTDADRQEFLDEHVYVTLSLADSGATYRTKDTSTGIVLFSNVDAGYYTINVGSSNSYSSAESGTIILEAGTEELVEVVVSETILGKVKIKVRDSTSSDEIDNAMIILRKDDEAVEAPAFTDSNGYVEFSLTEEGPFWISADHEDYCMNTRTGLDIGGTIYTIYLTRFAPGLCGADLNVLVIDEDGEPVKNATVNLYDEDEFVILGMIPKTTDLNGIARFRGVENGDYKAFAFKGSYSNWSDPIKFIAKSDDPQLLTVTLIIPDGTIKIIARDSAKEPIGVTTVTFYNADSGERIGTTTTDGNSVKEYTSKADKSIYFVVRKDGYATFTSKEYDVLPNTTQEIYVKMIPRIISGKPELKLVGIVDKQGNNVTVVAPDEEYIAKFELQVPETGSGDNYTGLGFHVRAGSKNAMEREQFFLTKVNVPGSKIIVKSTSFNPPNNYSQDIEHVTEGSAKWINVELTGDSITSGVTQVEAEFTVRKTASINDKLELHYRSWAIKNGNIWERAPVDNELGEAEMTSAKHSLYANTNIKYLEIGIKEVCDDKFCYALSIIDLDEDLVSSITDSYEAEIFRRYELRFTVLNNSDLPVYGYPNALLKLENPEEKILLGNYSVTKAEADPVSGNVAGYESSWIEIGDFEPKTSFSGRFKFIPQEEASSALTIQAKSDLQVVYSKTILINTVAGKEFEIEVKPEKLVAGIEKEITVTVKEKGKGIEIADALVSIEDRFGDRIAEKRSNSMGKAVLSVPAQQPGEKLYIVVEKAGYKVLRYELVVSDEIISIEPDTIGFSVNVTTKKVDEKLFSIENLVPYDLTIYSLEFQGDFDELIDLSQANDWINTYTGGNIEEEEKRELLARIYTSEFASRQLEGKTVEGKLLIEVGTRDNTWLYEVPVKVSVNIGGSVDDPACLEVTKSSWRAMTEGNPVQLSFDVQNNCTIGGQPIPLHNLEAKIEWESNHLGRIGLKMGELTKELRPGYYRVFEPVFEAEDSKGSVLTFTPDPQVNGLANGKIIFQASNPTGGEMQKLSTELEFEISAVNLRECISVSDDIIEIKQGETGEFEIETHECGGTTSFEIESDLTLSETEFSLEGSGSEKITVTAEDMPGQYPIYVRAKGQDQKKMQLIDMVRVVTPSDSCIELSKYEYDVFPQDNGENGYDVAELHNRCYSKGVTGVTIDTRSWSDALKDGFQRGLIWALLGWLGDKDDGQGQANVTKASFGNVKNVTAENLSKAFNQAIPQARASMGNSSPTLSVDSLGQSDNIVTVTVGGTRNLRYFIDQESKSWNRNKADYAQLQGTQLTLINNLENEVQNILLGMEGTPVAGAEVAPSSGVGLPNPLEKEKSKIGEPCANHDNCESGKCDYTTKKCVNTLQAKALGEIPTTAYLNFFGGGDSGSILGGGSGGGLLGGLGGAFMGLGSTILGEPDPWTWGLWGVLYHATDAYSKQGVIAMERPVEAADLSIEEMIVLKESGLESVEDEDISVRDLEQYSVSAAKENYVGIQIGGEASGDMSLKERSREIAFINETGITQDNPSKPLFRIFKVAGERLDYKRSYGKTLPKELAIDEDKTEDFKEKFNLQFNSYHAQECGPDTFPCPAVERINCQLGELVGNTGEDAAPKIVFAWDWSEIPEDACDELNKDHVYCDATQFSISLMKKLKKVKDFLDQYGSSLYCPSLGAQFSSESQDLHESELDIGITRMSWSKDGQNVKAVLSIGTNIQGSVDVGYIMELKNSSGNIVDSCTGTAERVSKQSKTVECVLERQGTGSENFVLNARATPNLSTCTSEEHCEDNEAENNSISLNLNFSSSGITQCEPFKLSRLQDFVEASEHEGVSFPSGTREQVLSYANGFSALLVRDGYSDDLRHDFHEFSINNSFFGTPTWYTDGEEGIGKYFDSENRFSFSYPLVNQGAYAEAGVYEAKIEIEFDEGVSDWKLFNGGEMQAKITVNLFRKKAPKPDSPFYYLPFNGRIGIDSDNGRQRYGINYVQEAQEPIEINSDPMQRVITSEIIGSNPAAGKLLGGFEDSFTKLNNEKRGIVLDVRRLITDTSAAETRLTLSPSYATPVMMNVQHEKAEDAFGFYSIDVGGEPQTGSSRGLLPWSGVGVQCRDFFDQPIVDAFDDRYDMHAIDAECALIGGTSLVSFGLEWCNPVRSGNIYVESVVFTPQGKSSSMKRIAGSDSMTLITDETVGENILLNGVRGQAFNYAGGDEINVERILELVKQGKVCVSGYDNSMHSMFFWNPKPVLESMQDNVDNALNNCITGK